MDAKKLFTARMDRRRLLGNLGLMGAGAALTACSTVIAGPDPEPRNVDAAILNFALNLEYLEAAFYLAAVGRLELLPGGSADLTFPDGVVGSNPSESWDKETREFAEELAQDEYDHVVFLRAALQSFGLPVAERPVMDFKNSFAAAAEAAFGLPAGDGLAFNPYANELLFLHGTFVFEDVGVTAYNGAAPLIRDAENVLAPAAGILAVEAYHSGAVRKLLYQERDTMTPFGVPVKDVVQGISDLRGAVGGGKDQGILLAAADAQGKEIVREGRGNIAVTDENGIAFARTPREVANIVFLSDGEGSGGFFPNGISVPSALADDFGFLLDL